MISGLKEYPKASKSVLQKAQYEQKKNSSVNLKKCINGHSNSELTYLNFKSNLKNYNQKSYVVAVSGGPDSLALVALSKIYGKEEKKILFLRFSRP